MYTINPTIDADEAICLKNEQIQDNYNITWLENEYNYYDTYCYNYALDDTNIMNCRDAFKKLDNKYKQISIQDAKEGDIISYHEINDYFKDKKPSYTNAVHFAKIHKTRQTLGSTVIRSKWGEMGVFETSIEFVPDCYGTAILIWRKK